MDKSLVLFSGGLDSAVALHAEQAAGTLAGVVHFVYPHPAQSHERRAVIETRQRWYCRSIDVPWFDVDLPLRAAALDIGAGQAGPRIVAARNLAFLSFAANIAASIGAGRVVIGASQTDADAYPDCRAAYLADASALLAPFGIRIAAPLAEMTRPEIRQQAHRYGLSMSMVWSCYQPIDGRPCRTCDSCMQDAEL